MEDVKPDTWSGVRLVRCVWQLCGGHHPRGPCPPRRNDISTWPGSPCLLHTCALPPHVHSYAHLQTHSTSRHGCEEKTGRVKALSGKTGSTVIKGMTSGQVCVIRACSCLTSCVNDLESQLNWRRGALVIYNGNCQRSSGMMILQERRSSGC